MTDESGRYIFTKLIPGTYTLAATFTGFGAPDQRVEIVASQTSQLDIQMSLGGVPLGEGCPSVAEGSPAQPVSARDFVRLERSTPTYSVEVRGDGAVLWRGGDRSHEDLHRLEVEISGERDATIEPEAARALIEKFRNPAFWQLCARYEFRGTPDGRTRIETSHRSPVTIKVRIADREKQVENYAKMGPDALQDFEKEIDRTADTHRWIHGDSKSEVFSSNLAVDSAGGVKPGVTPLMLAIGRGDIAQAQALLAAKADPNARDSSGWTALMYASYRGQSPELIQMLLASGADPNLRSEMGQTALMAAVLGTNETVAVARALISSGADVNAQDWNGENAIMLATHVRFWSGGFHERAETLAALYGAGARLNAVDAKGRTVFDHLDLEAAENSPLRLRYEEMKAILRSPVPGTVPVRAAGRVVTAPNSLLQRIVLQRVGAGVDDIETPVAPDGSFVLEKILPGTYTVQPLPAPTFPIALKPLHIPNANTTDLQIAIPGLREIAVRVEVEGNRPPPTFALGLAGDAGGANHATAKATHVVWGSDSPLPPVLASALTGGADLHLIRIGIPINHPSTADLVVWMPFRGLGAASGTRPDGAYTIILPEGEYPIAVMLSREMSPVAGRVQFEAPDYSVTSMTEGTTNLLANPLLVDRTQKKEIRITLKPTRTQQWVKVSGRVIGLPDALLGQAKIRLEGEVIGVESVVKADGSFEFPQALPGEYSIRVLDPDVSTTGDVELQNATLSRTWLTIPGKDIGGIEIVIGK
jgi:hypothetical protein